MREQVERFVFKVVIYFLYFCRMLKLLCGLCQQLQRDQQRFPRRKISEEPQPQQLPFSPYSDTFAHRVHSNRVGEQVFTEANPYITGPEPPVHPNLRQQSFQSREDTVGISVVVVVAGYDLSPTSGV